MLVMDAAAERLIVDGHKLAVDDHKFRNVIEAHGLVVGV